MKSFVLILLCIFGRSCGLSYSTYGFYRKMEGALNTRRVFGGAQTFLSDFPQACVLTDKNHNAKCSGAVVSSHWVLTAAHCIKGDLVYVKYNTRTPNLKGDRCTIVRLYRHPQFKVVEEDEGRGQDVTQLYHDIGLVKTRDPIRLEHQLQANSLFRMKKLNPKQLLHAEVEFLGFGRTEALDNSEGEELFSVKLILQKCERSTWYNCLCGVPPPGARARGVCSGDSGGPVVLNGTQVGVTSMGPLECMTRYDPSPTATSVFTAVYDYVDMLNRTINTPETSSMTLVALSRTNLTKQKGIGFVVACMLLMLMFVM